MSFQTTKNWQWAARGCKEEDHIVEPEKQIEWKFDKSFLLTSLKGLCVGRKDTLKISIARIPFLCCLCAAIKYYRLLQRRDCRKGENRLFSSHVQVPAASLSYLQASNIYVIFYCLCQFACPREGSVIPTHRTCT